MMHQSQKLRWFESYLDSEINRKFGWFTDYLTTFN